MSGIDWGNVPTWFGAIGTTGALCATLGVIVRDHRKDERGDAANLTCWFEWPADDDYNVDIEHIGLLHVSNAGDRPLSYLSVFVGPDEHMNYTRKHVAHVLQPASEATFPVPFRTHGYGLRPPSEPGAVLFQDAAGIWWARDLKTKILYRRRRRRLRKFLRRQRLWISNFGWRAFNPRFRRSVSPPPRPDWRG